MGSVDQDIDQLYRRRSSHAVANRRKMGWAQRRVEEGGLGGCWEWLTSLVVRRTAGCPPRLDLFGFGFLVCSHEGNPLAPIRFIALAVRPFVVRRSRSLCGQGGDQRPELQRYGQVHLRAARGRRNRSLEERGRRKRIHRGSRRPRTLRRPSWRAGNGADNSPSVSRRARIVFEGAILQGGYTGMAPPPARPTNHFHPHALSAEVARSLLPGVVDTSMLNERFRKYAEATFSPKLVEPLQNLTVTEAYPVELKAPVQGGSCTR